MGETLERATETTTLLSESREKLVYVKPVLLYLGTIESQTGSTTYIEM